MINGNPSNAAVAGGKGFFASNKRGSLQETLDLIRLRYVDSVKFDLLEGKAIKEIMTELDPHSVYLSSDVLKEANELSIPTISIILSVVLLVS